MRFTELFFYTLREDPVEAEIASHRLMLRAGMIRRLASGVYAFLPLGFRVFKKVEKVVREEMNRAGAQELIMPVLQPLELWEESGRLDAYVAEKILFQVKDRQERRYALGPTHEEVITDIARARIRSWRDMPVNLYQIQVKFRDEIRPRFGLLRAKEFCMKDAYSFDADEEGLERSYRAMYDAYSRIFTRCGLKFRAVEADTGAIGGDVSHEFMATADAGEDVLVECGGCGYAANLERAEAGAPDKDPAEMLEMERLETPGAKTIEEVTAFLGVTPQRLVKTLLYLAGGRPVAALIRGDHTLNETKLKRLLREESLMPADAGTIERLTGAPVGFAGPAGLAENTPVVSDITVAAMRNFITGGNRRDLHVGNVNPGRDFRADRTGDIRFATEGDKCPRCGGRHRFMRGIEVGQIFKLGVKYSAKMGLEYTDAAGETRLVVMGCYGIGVSRTVAAAVEQNNDGDGIIWTPELAPYLVDIIPVSMKDAAQREAAERAYAELWEAGIEAIMDDRDERPGVKFKDADLIGFPLKIVIGKALADGKVELQARRTGEKTLVPASETVRRVREAAGGLQ
ncbi:MAG: proline--tRNA ligase [bacterium]